MRNIVKNILIAVCAVLAICGCASKTKIHTPVTVDETPEGPERSRAEVQAVIMRRVPELRSAYNMRLVDKPGDVTEILYPFVFTQ
jgi:hypothetical protein